MPWMWLKQWRAAPKAEWAGVLGVVVMLVVSVALVSSIALARKVVGPPSRESIADVWVGLSEDELYLFRVALSLDGTGTIGFVFAGGEPVVYTVANWRYSKGEVEIDTDFPSDDRDWDGPLQGTVNERAMFLKLSGKGWFRRLSLRREASLESAWIALREAMTRTGKKASVAD